MKDRACLIKLFVNLAFRCTRSSTGITQPNYRFVFNRSLQPALPRVSHNMRLLHTLPLISSVLAQNAFDGGPFFTTLDIFPSPNTTGLGGWEAALVKADAFVSELNLTEKAYMVTGVDEACVGTIRAIPRLNFSGLCLQDGPAAIRQADLASAFPAGLTAAATWDKALIYRRGLAIAEEFRGKGAHVILGPVVGPLGR